MLAALDKVRGERDGKGFDGRHGDRSRSNPAPELRPQQHGRSIGPGLRTGTLTPKVAGEWVRIRQTEKQGEQGRVYV